MLKIPTEMQCRARASHLKQLGSVQELLSALNDPYISPDDLAAYVERIPVLAGRCVRRAVDMAPSAKLDSFSQVLGLIGNQGLEALLLGLLEDLTVLRAELG